MKDDKRLAILIVSVIAMFLWVYVRPVWVRSNCYKTTHDIRPHENDSDWSEGKHWIGLNLLQQYENDQKGKDHKAGWRYTNNKEKDNEVCLLRNGLK